jgi:hypothetical protein
MEMKIGFVLIVALVICCPAISIEYQSYDNGFFKAEYPTNWVIYEPQREDIDQGGEFASLLESQPLVYTFINTQIQKNNGQVGIKMMQMAMVQVDMPNGRITVSLPDYRKSFFVFNQTGYIDDPLLKGLNETEYMNDPLLHFLSTFQVKPKPNLKEITDSKLPSIDEQLNKIVEGQQDEAASVRHPSALGMALKNKSLRY